MQQVAVARGIQSRKLLYNYEMDMAGQSGFFRIRCWRHEVILGCLFVFLYDTHINSCIIT